MLLCPSSVLLFESELVLLSLLLVLLLSAGLPGRSAGCEKKRSSISFSASGAGCAGATGRVTCRCTLAACAMIGMSCANICKDRRYLCGMQRVLDCPDVCSKAGGKRPLPQHLMVQAGLIHDAAIV